jgi:hypothetical protein
MNKSIRSFPFSALTLCGALFAVALTLASGLTTARAAFVDLGEAQQYAALALYHDIMISGPSGVTGNAGVANSAANMDVGDKLDISGSSFVTGNADLHTGVTYNHSGTAFVGQLNQNAATDNILNQAFNDALNAATFAASLSGQNLNVSDNNLTISKASVGNYAFNLSNINLSGTHAITLSAPVGSTFTFNITGGFMLSGSSNIHLAGGLTQNDVLYNIIGNGSNVTLSGGAYVEGVILAPHRQADIGPTGAAGFTVNQIIADAISIHSGGMVVTPVPEVAPSSVIFGFLGLVVAVSSRRVLGGRVRAVASRSNVRK